ncbi:MAG: neutral/alkaline non-lysosomal ceramidase N-terminal domain-containing protein [Thermoguttaceae bacterium]
MSELRVGTAVVDITPPAGLPLMGNFRDDYAARGVHDPLLAEAIVFADGKGVKAGVLAVDNCMLDRENVALIREAIAAGCDVPPENVLVHATHTHSAPAASGKIGLANEVAPHRAAIEAFLRKAASAVIEADGRLEEASLEFGHTSEEGVSFNRRLRRRDGSTQMNWEALGAGFDPGQVAGTWGPTDPEMVCLVVRRRNMPPTALVNFGLHPAILAGDNWLYSADYPGYLRSALGRRLGEGGECLFVNGCCGDVNHVDYRDRDQGRGYEMAERVGLRLAAAAGRAIESAEPLGKDCVGVAREQVMLERLKIGRAERQWCENVLEEARRRPPQGQVDGVPDSYFAALRLQMARVQDEPDGVEVMALRVGDAALVGLPGEAFCELGLEIKRRSPARHTLVAGLSNDAIGYLPTRAAFDQGGYEPTAGSTFYEPGSGERLVEAAVKLVGQLFQE